jgi:hypothetical protein
MSKMVKFNGVVIKMKLSIVYWILTILIEIAFTVSYFIANDLKSIIVLGFLWIGQLIIAEISSLRDKYETRT